MASIHSDEFKRDAVRIATTSGLTKRQVASDLGVGLSTLNKWVKMVSDEAGPIQTRTFCARMSGFGVRTGFLRRRGSC
jgi:transposase-like protein